MKRWGLVVTAYYVVLLIVLFGPAFVLFGSTRDDGIDCYQLVSSLALVIPFTGDGFWPFTLWALVLLVGQVMLLFMTADLTRTKPVPRRSIAFTASATALMLAMLVTAAAVSLVEAISLGVGDGVLGGALEGFAEKTSLLFLASSWLFWGAVFWLHLRGGIARLDAALRWLLAGSVMELLVAIPSHVYVRQREQCCAPMVTGFGIVTGIAVMIACFGPGVIALYLKRIRAKSASGTVTRSDADAAASRLMRTVFGVTAVTLAMVLTFALGAKLILDRSALAARSEMVTVPAGAFQLEGGGAGDPHATSRRIEIARPFAVGRRPVTLAATLAFQQASCHEALKWSNDVQQADSIDDRKDVEDYLRWLASKTDRHYRLLSDAEWQYLFGDAGTARRLGVEPIPEPMLEWVADCWSDDAQSMPADGSAWVPPGGCERFVLRGTRRAFEPPPGASQTRRPLDPGDQEIAGFRLAEDVE